MARCCLVRNVAAVLEWLRGVFQAAERNGVVRQARNGLARRGQVRAGRRGLTWFGIALAVHGVTWQGRQGP